MAEHDDKEQDGYTFRERIVALEVQIKFMRGDILNETNQRATANGERRVELERLNSKIDMLNADRSKDNEKLTEKLEKMSDKQDKTARIVYIIIGIGVAADFLIQIFAATKR